jgi:uncharacterized protein (DUF1330 family)
MAAYLIAGVKVNNDSWMPDYASKVHDIVHKHGGKYLSRSGNITTVEGEPSGLDIIALVEFPSVEAAKAFCSDPEYAPFAEARIAGTESRFEIIDDTDAAGTIPYLGKTE